MHGYKWPINCTRTRSVYPWREDVWQVVVCGIAREVVYQKFAQWPNARRDLLRTGDKLLAEVTRNDQVRTEPV